MSRMCARICSQGSSAGLCSLLPHVAAELPARPSHSSSNSDLISQVSFPPMESNSSSGWGNSSAAVSAASGWGCAAAPTAATSGWSTAASGWGRSESSNESVSQSRQSPPRAASPKPPISSWARAVSGHVPQQQPPGSNCTNNSRSHCDNKNSTESSSKATTELEKETRSVPPVDPVLLQPDCWGQTVSTLSVSCTLS